MSGATTPADAPTVPATIVCCRCKRSLGTVRLGNRWEEPLCFGCAAAARAEEEGR